MARMRDPQAATIGCAHPGSSLSTHEHSTSFGVTISEVCHWIVQYIASSIQTFFKEHDRVYQVHGKGVHIVVNDTRTA